MAGAVPSVNKFLLQFVELYDANKTLRDYLVVSLAKTFMCKLSSRHNSPKIEENVTGFIRVLVTYNKTCAYIASDNMGGPYHR